MPIIILLIIFFLNNEPVSKPVAYKLQPVIETNYINIDTLYTSQSCLDTIKYFEGLLLNDTNNYIGYGHFNFEKFKKISTKQADSIFQKDILYFEKKIKQYYKRGINQNQFDAFVSFSFNLGFGYIKILEKTEYNFELFIHTNGKILNPLKKRRIYENKKFNNFDKIN